MSTSKWPAVPLSDVLSLRIDAVAARPDTQFKIAGVYSFGRGLFRREPVSGTDTTYKHFHRLHENDYVISQPKAWEGAICRIPAAFDGWFLSPVFPTFRANANLLDVRYLEWFGKQSNVWERLRGVARGMGARRDSVHPNKFLSLTIPLPSLEEQQRIVERIDFLADRIAKLRHLRCQVSDSSDELCRSLIRNSSTTLMRMSELVTLREPDVKVSPNENYHFAGVYCFGKGVFAGQHKSGMEFQYPRLTRLRTGDFVYPKLMAWEGALGSVPPECDGLVVSTEFPVFSVNSERVLPEVLDVHFRTPQVWPRLSGASTGTNVRRRRLNPADFLRYEFPLPPMEVQLQLRRVKSKLDEVQSDRRSSTREFSAIMPSVLDRAFRGEL